MQLDFAFLKYVKNLKNCFSNSFAFDLCILVNLAFDGPNLTFLHRHNGLAILISRESWTQCRTRTPHVAVVSRETSPSPHATLFFPRAASFLRAPPSFFAWRRRRSITASFSCSDARLGDPSPLLYHSVVILLGFTAVRKTSKSTRCCRVKLITEIDRNEGIACDGRRNYARKRKRMRDARENFPRRWKIPELK